MAERVEVFEQMLAPDLRGDAAAGPAEHAGGAEGARPASWARCASASAKEQRSLEDIDTRGRDGRQRFGFAVDALGLDTSKAKDEVRVARTELERLSGDTKVALAAYVEVQRELLSWEGRSGLMEPYPQLASAHRQCASAVDAWLEVRKRERAGRALLEEKERTASDLEYQITALRNALANHERGIDRDRETTHRHAIELSAEAERMEHQLLQLATRFCEPLRSRPDLGPLFQQLESDAAATN